MTRHEFVRRFVLNEIGDDYENLEHVSPFIIRDSERVGLTISRDEIVQAMAELIQAGLAQAYKLSSTSPTAEVISGVPPHDELAEYYFLATPKGMQLHVSDDEWYPFDKNGALRKDWKAPEI